MAAGAGVAAPSVSFVVDPEELNLFLLLALLKKRKLLLRIQGVLLLLLFLM